MRNHFVAVCKYFLAFCFLCLVWSSDANAQSNGQFSGDLLLHPMPDGQNMELRAPFSYKDSAGVSWSVPAGTQVDGASIPSVFWSILGAPFTGKYREASVIHDYYCQTHSRHWKAVHRVFYDGMLARGVDSTQASLMYLAVYRFGPRWDFDVDACYCRGCPICANPELTHVDHYQSTYNAEDFAELTKKLNGGLKSLTQLEDLADFQLNTEILNGHQN
jgi:hypothetical protein